MSKTMSTMNKDEKRLMLFDMQEHPEKYTDEQVERLLADEEAQEFLRDLAMAKTLLTATECRLQPLSLASSSSRA